MSEEVKQEGEFKMKTPTKPKNLGKKNEVTKIEIPKEGIESQGEVIPEVTKVEIKNKDAVQTQETNDSDAIVKESQDSGNSEEVVEEIRATDEGVESPLTIVEDVEEEKQQEVVQEQQVVEQKQLPENIDKLVTFMEETGGTVQDYVRLNADYTNVDSTALIREYYKQTKPHLDSEDVSLLLEDFDYDEDIDEPKEIRKKKIAFKEEAAKAKDFLEGLKGKYYDEIKLRPGVTQEQQEALSFYDRYKKQQEKAQAQHGDFRDRTKKLFNKEFKGFDFNVGDKKFRYGVKDPAKVGETQVDVQNFVSKYLDKDGNMTDPSGYHKAMYAAMNADKLAHHFYEQGKADGIKGVITNSKNPAQDGPRQVADGNVFINGLKVKSISGLDSSKLKIKTKKFN